MKKCIACAAALLSLAGGAFAQEVEFRPLIGMGLTFGGDAIGDAVRFDDGSSVQIRGGGQIAFSGGVEAQFTPELSGQALLSYHFFNANGGGSGSVRYERTPVELLLHYRLSDGFRLGGGTRYVGSATVRGSGLGSGYVVNEDFKPAWGLVIEGEFLVGRNLGFKLRYVSEKLESSTFPGSQNLDASHAGAYMIYYFN